MSTSLVGNLKDLASPGNAGRIDNAYHPGGQGNNIYQLLRVIRNGREHLVGSVSKGDGFIVDFTTGETLYDFLADFGGAPRLGNDSYCCTAIWRNPSDGITRYYFGGWFKAPANVPTSGTQDHTNKYSYLVETADFVTWNVIVKDKAQAADSWQAEVSDLIATNDALYVVRGDWSPAGDAPADYNQGLWKYTGGAVHGTVPTLTRITSDGTLKGILYMDEVVLSQVGTANVERYDPSAGDAQRTSAVYSGITIQGNSLSTRTDGGLTRGAFGVLGGLLVHGSNNGYYIGDVIRDKANTRFVPLAVPPNDGGAVNRIVGWRSQIRQVAGGVMFPANADCTSNTDAALSFLYWMGPSGTLKIIDIGGGFGAIEVFRDKVYYGITSGHLSTPITNYKLDNPMLASMKLTDLKALRPPAFSENWSFAGYVPPGAGSGSGSFGYIGGYPTLGYTKGTLVITSTVAGLLTPKTLNPGKSSIGTNQAVKYAQIELLANTQAVIDLTPYLDGGILGFEFSASGALSARISLS